MVGDKGRGVEMMHRTSRDAVAASFAALQAGRFAAARDAAAGFLADPAARLLHALGRAGAGDLAAVAVLDGIARANPAARHPVHDLVDLLHRFGRSADAAPALRAALALRPADVELTAALGAALSEHGEAADTVAAFRSVAAARPGDAAAWSNLGKALAAQGKGAEAEDAFAAALRLAPGNARLRLNHGVMRLRTGRLAEGWPLFRARHALPNRAPPPPGPELTGVAAARGRTVLLLHDEGFGDTIQFIRYAPLLEAEGARVLVAVPPPLRRLLAGNGLPLAGASPRYDFWCRIPDLACVFGTAVETIPAALPYLVPDDALVSAWAGRLPPGPRRVGLVWAGAGRPHDPAAAATDRVRSIPEALLGPLLAVEGVRWISLQHGRAAQPGVFDPMRGVADFADTAAIIAGLDGVVSVDTAVAHLAGAMGKPVLLLDRFDNCWRWLGGRVDSPWYPGVLSILRQERPGDWPGVLLRAADHLRKDKTWLNG